MADTAIIMPQDNDRLILCAIITIVIEMSFFLFACTYKSDKVTDLAACLNMAVLAVVTFCLSGVSHVHTHYCAMSQPCACHPSWQRRGESGGGGGGGGGVCIQRMLPTHVKFNFFHLPLQCFQKFDKHLVRASNIFSSKSHWHGGKHICICL